MVTAGEALRRLRDGNRRFVEKRCKPERIGHQPSRTTGRQQPFAIILGCSDSRAPAALVFDQDLGDLFVVYVAGNIASPSQLGSIEYAAASLATPLVVVMGHSGCGAVQAAVAQVRDPALEYSDNLQSIVDFIRPSVEALRAGASRDDESLAERSVRKNIMRTVRHLRQDSEILNALVEKGKLLIVGAEYSLETGEVEFLGGSEETL